MRRIAPAPLPGLAMALLLAGAAAQAQTQGLVREADDRQPIEILADEALEWQRDQRRYIARGNAELNRGSLSVTARRLTAAYRDGPGDRPDIYRIGAEGNVTLRDAGLTATGTTGIYDLDRGIAVLRGEGLRLTGDGQQVTARDSLEYFEAESVFVARGQAVLTRAGDTVRAEVMTARLNAAGEITRIDAIGAVEIRTGADLVTADEAVYDLVANQATALGSVIIRREDNILTGDMAEIDMATGISRLSGRGGRVRALFTPAGDDE